MGGSKFILGEYAKNIVKVASGASVAVFLPLLLSPVLSRIYNQSDYGVMAVFMGVVVIFTSVITSHYNHTILLQKTLKGTINSITLVILINVIITSILILAVTLFNNDFAKFISSDNITVPGRLFFLIPATICSNGLAVVLMQWFNKHKKFGTITALRLTNTIGAIGFQLGYALIVPYYWGTEPNYTGLILGYSLGSFLTLGVGTIVVIYSFKMSILRLINWPSIKFIAIKERDFLIYSLPNDFLFNFANELPTFVLKKFLSNSQIGNYSYARRFSNLPIQTVANSVLEVFKQKSIEETTVGGNCRNIFVKTFKSLAIVGLAPLVVITLFGPQLFAFVFGKDWYMAGEFARLLAPMYYLNFISGPLSYMFIFHRKLIEDLLVHIYIIFSSAGALWLGHSIFGSAYGMIAIFSANYCLTYIYYLLRSYKMSQSAPLKK